MKKLLLVGSLIVAAAMTGCGGSSGSGSGSGGGGNGGGGNGGGGNSVSVSIAPSAATVAVSGMQQFSATVSPSTATQTVTWTVTAGNTGCSGSACGTVDATGLYTAPAALPAGNPPQVKVTATSTQDTTKSSTATVTLVSTQNSRISGTYTFRFNGYNGTGSVLAIGNLVTDGNGNVTGGAETFSTSGGASSTFSITGGMYSVGGDGRGDMVVTNSHGDTFCYVFAVGSTTLDNPLFVQFNNVTAPIACTGVGMGTGTHGSGVMNLASRSNFGPSAINQPYVFELNGVDASGKRTSYIGRFVGDGAGNVSSWMLDRNDDASASGLLSGTGTYTISNSTGSGTIALTGGPTLNVYIKDNNELVLSVASDPGAANSIAQGVAESQDTKPAYDNTTLNGISVFYASGVGTTAGSGWAVAGLATTNGAGGLTGSFDQNNAGNITMNGSFSGSYNGTGSGRYTITLNGVPYLVYAITNNKGFLMDQASPQVLSGLIEPQAANPTANTIGGTFVETAHQDTTSADVNLVAALNLNNSGGGISGTQDETNSSEMPNLNVVGSYTVSSNGRGTFNLTAPSTFTGIVYVINQSKFVVIPVDATNTTPQILVDVR